MKKNKGEEGESEELRFNLDYEDRSLEKVISLKLNSKQSLATGRKETTLNEFRPGLIVE